MSAEVVVGVSGTPSSERAVRWAGEAAVVRHAELVLVHAVGDAVSGYGLWDDGVAAGVQEVLDREADRVRAALPTLTVRTEIDLDRPARCLTNRSGTAALVVVGTRRTTQAQRVFSGSLAYQVVAGAHCPVAVVPPATAPSENRVVVGADGSPDSVAAVRAGAHEADVTGGVLEVVHAWQEVAVIAPVTPEPARLWSIVRDDEQVVLAEATAGLAEDFPGLVVERTLVESSPAEALLAAAARARLVVIGSRGRHGIARMLLGSTSHAVVLHSPSPVLVVRSP